MMEVHVCHDKERGVAVDLIASSILFNDKWYACAVIYALEVMRQYIGSDVDMVALKDALPKLNVLPVDMLIHLESADRFERAIGFALQRSMRTMFEKMMEKDIWQPDGGLYQVMRQEITSLHDVKSLEAVLAEEASRPMPGKNWHLPASDLRPFWRRLLPLVRLRSDMLSRKLRIDTPRLAKVTLLVPVLDRQV